MRTESLTDLLAPYARRIEEHLERRLVEPGTPEALAEAMRYCVLGGGKRLRPALVFMAAEAVDGEVNDLTARAAVAVELVHCYSLVHDDLPAMDDDELRRGQPTAHVRYGEAMAILVGDALLTRAFGVLTETGDPRGGPLAAELARGSGPAGMVAGQVADLELCDVPAGGEGVHYIHLRKTAALIQAAARMGALAAGADEAELQATGEYAESLGMAFQLVDDLLDVTAEAGVLGKTPGKDQASGKRTLVAEAGLEHARALADDFTRRAIETADRLGPAAGKLRTLAELLSRRGH